jgi:hypothetical protein
MLEIQECSGWEIITTSLNEAVCGKYIGETPGNDIGEL